MRLPENETAAWTGGTEAAAGNETLGRALGEDYSTGSIADKADDANNPFFRPSCRAEAKTPTTAEPVGDEFDIAGDNHPDIPEGEYLVRYFRHDLRQVRRYGQ